MADSSIRQFQYNHQRLQWLGQKQQVHADNLARASVPQQHTKAVSPFSFRERVAQGQNPGTPVQTHPGHLSGHTPKGAYAVKKDKDQPVQTLTNNTIDPERDLAHMNEAGIEAQKQIATQRDMVGRLKMIYNLGSR
jgi:flagellar basal body rod protein FlgB